MTFRVIFSAAAAGLLLGASAVRADTVVFARSGPWEAFGGTAANGTAVCGMSTSWPDDRYFGVKYFKGDNTVVIQLGSPHWRIEDGAKQRVIMQIDRRGPWGANATGMHFSATEAGLGFSISRNQLDTFIAEFRYGDVLGFAFPNTTADNWSVSLRGTNAVTSSFANCIEAM